MNLKILDVSNNRIARVEGLETLTQVFVGGRGVSAVGWGVEPAAGPRECATVIEARGRPPASPARPRCPLLARRQSAPPAPIPSPTLSSSHPPRSLLSSCSPLQLSDLWLNDNQIESLDEVEAALQPQRPTLSCIYLKGNPCASAPSYALRLRHLLPHLAQLDDNPVA